MGFLSQSVYLISRRQFITFFSACFLLLSLSACSNPLARNFPTPMPSEQIPTAIALTVEASGLVIPTQAPSPTITHTAQPIPVSPTPLPSEMHTEQAAIIPTDIPPVSTNIEPTVIDVTQEIVTSSPDEFGETPTATPFADISYATIQITKPGPLSKLSSPFQVRAFLKPGPGGKVRIELLGEDGRVLLRKLLVFASEENFVNLVTEIEFEISAVAEFGRIQVSVDDGFGRLAALASEDIILLSEGPSEINVGGDNLENIIIQQPRPNILVQGGQVLVSGLARMSADEYLVVELLNSNGIILGSRVTAPLEPSETEHEPFAVEVPYTISDSTWVRLVIRLIGHRIPGTIHLSSVEVLLSP